jgi:hypothetical protein
MMFLPSLRCSRIRSRYQDSNPLKTFQKRLRTSNSQVIVCLLLALHAVLLVVAYTSLLCLVHKLLRICQQLSLAVAAVAAHYSCSQLLQLLACMDCAQRQTSVTVLSFSSGCNHSNSSGSVNTNTKHNPARIQQHFYISITIDSCQRRGSSTFAHAAQHNVTMATTAAAVSAVYLQRRWKWQLSDFKAVTFSRFKKERSTIPCKPSLIAAQHLLLTA